MGHVNLSGSVHQLQLSKMSSAASSGQDELAWVDLIHLKMKCYILLTPGVLDVSVFIQHRLQYAPNPLSDRIPQSNQSP